MPRFAGIPVEEERKPRFGGIPVEARPQVRMLEDVAPVPTPTRLGPAEAPPDATVEEHLPATAVRYNAPGEVLADMQAGVLSPEDAEVIWREKFGMDLTRPEAREAGAQERARQFGERRKRLEATMPFAVKDDPFIGALTRGQQQLVEGAEKVTEAPGIGEKALGVAQFAFAPSAAVGGTIEEQALKAGADPEMAATLGLGAEIGLPAGAFTTAVGKVVAKGLAKRAAKVSTRSIPPQAEEPFLTTTTRAAQEQILDKPRVRLTAQQVREASEKGATKEQLAERVAPEFTREFNAEDLLREVEDLEAKIPGLNLAKYYEPGGEAKTVLANVQRDFPELIERARGAPITWKASNVEAVRTANLLGTDVNTMRKRFPDPGKAMSDLTAARLVTVKSAANLERTLRAAVAGDTAAVQRVYGEVLEHAERQAVLGGATAEHARTLGSLRQQLAVDPLKNVDLLGKMAQDPEALARQLVDMIDEGGLEAGSKAVGAIGRGRWDKVFQWWLNGVLSGPFTHAVNIQSNAFTLATGLTERAVVNLLKGDNANTLGRMVGLTRGVGPAFRAARDEVLGRTTDAASKTAQAGVHLDLIPKWALTPTKALRAEDVFFKTLIRRSHLTGEATSRGMRQGLRGRALADFVEREIRDPGEAILKRANQEAEEFTFTNKPGDISGLFLRARNVVPGFRYIVPFVSTTGNIIKFGLKRSPLAPMFREVRKDLLRGGDARKAALTRIGIGSLVFAHSFQDALEGKLTGPPPREKSERETWYAAGNKPWSMLTEEGAIPYDRTEPFGYVTSIAATAAQAWKDDEAWAEGAKDAALGGILGLAQAMADKTYFRSVGDMVEAIGQQDINKLQRTFRSIGEGFIPYGAAIRQLYQMIGSGELPDEGFLAQFGIDPMRTIEEGELVGPRPRLDIFGEPVPRPTGPAAALPLGTDPVSKYPEAEELLRHGVFVGAPSRTMKFRGADVKLNDDQYFDLKQLRGRELRKQISNVMNSEPWDRLPTETRQKTLENIRRQSAERARRIWLTNNWRDLAAGIHE